MTDEQKALDAKKLRPSKRQKEAVLMWFLGVWSAALCIMVSVGIWILVR